MTTRGTGSLSTADSLHDDGHLDRVIPNSRRFAGKIDFRLILLALAITITQVALATLSGRGNSWSDRYLSLWIWDGGWYANIMAHGYSLIGPADANGQINLAFFPGYPIAARFTFGFLPVSPGVTLLLTAQVSAWLFWGTLLRMLKAWRLPPTVIFAVVMLIFCHPAAFFLVVSYPESLFFACLLLFLSWGPRAGSSVSMMIGAALAGYLASATRIVGAPLAVLPLVWAWNDFRTLPHGSIFRRFVKGIWPYAVVSIGTAAGALSFLAFCSVRFGHWDMYLRAKAAGWGVGNFALTDLVRPEIFKPLVPRFNNDFLLAQDVSHLYVPVLLLSLISIPAFDWWRSRRGGTSGFTVRSAFYIGAWLLFLSLAGGAGLATASFFLRYGLYCHLLLLLALAHAYSQSRHRDKELDLRAQIVLFLACAFGLAVQLHFCSRFSHAVMVG
jgi:hypothetical protein